MLPPFSAAYHLSMSSQGWEVGRWRAESDPHRWWLSEGFGPHASLRLGLCSFTLLEAMCLPTPKLLHSGLLLRQPVPSLLLPPWNTEAGKSQSWVALGACGWLSLSLLRFVLHRLAQSRGSALSASSPLSTEYCGLKLKTAVVPAVPTSC